MFAFERKSLSLFVTPDGSRVEDYGTVTAELTWRSLLFQCTVPSKNGRLHSMTCTGVARGGGPEGPKPPPPQREWKKIAQPF